MKKSLKSILILFVLVFTFTSYCFADEGLIRDVKPIPPNEDHVETFTATALDYLGFAGYAIAIGMVVFIGIKYILASADEKASLKNVLPKVCVGACIVACSVPLTEFIISIFADL